MARNNFDQWIPVEYSPDVIQKVKQMSAVLAYGQNIPMATETRSTPRSGGLHMVGTAKGGTYTEDGSTEDSVYLYAQKFTGAVRVAEEDITDSLADIVNAKTVDAGTSFAKLFDNTCLGVTAAKGTATMADGSHPAFDSLYYILTQTDSATGYTANANITQTATAGGPTYANLSTALGLVESGDYWDDAEALVIAHPSVKAKLRNIVDGNNRPIFNESSNGTAGGGQGTGGTLFGHQIHWSLGAKTAANPTDTPTGNPLVVFCSAPYLMVGNRTALETMFIDPNTGLAALTDEAILKFRARKAFAPGHPAAFSILECRS